jgi:inner membrane protein involved in colicin E2 resistance
MKAFIGFFRVTRAKDWPHPSLDGEVDPAKRDRDEHIQADILTSGFYLAPAFPV